jgi:hypothetical protein
MDQWSDLVEQAAGSVESCDGESPNAWEQLVSDAAGPDDGDDEQPWAELAIGIADAHDPVDMVGGAEWAGLLDLLPMPLAISPLDGDDAHNVVPPSVDLFLADVPRGRCIVPLPDPPISKTRIRKCKGNPDDIEYLDAVASTVYIAKAFREQWPYADHNLMNKQLDDLFLHILKAAQHKRALGDDDVRAVVERYFAESRRMSSLSIEADETNLDRKYVQRARCLASCAAVGLDRFGRGVFERGVVETKGIECILYLDHSRHDCTTLSVRLRESLSQGRADEFVDLAAWSSNEVSPLWVDHTAQDVVPAKLMQVEGSFSMLVHCQGRYAHFRGSSLQCLLCLEFADAHSLLNSLERVSHRSDASERFDIRVRGSCTDSGANVLKAESLFRQSRPGWLQVNFPCKLHKVATAHTRTFAIIDDFLSLLINTSLSLQGSVNLFRRVLRDLIFEKTVLLRGSPNAEAISHRRSILALLLQGKDNRTMVQALTLDVLANGDWSKRDCVQHYVGDYHIGDEERTVRRFSRRLAFALLPRSPRIYPRSRWNGALHSVADICLVVCCHGLFEQAYCRWCSQLAKGDTADRKDAIPLPRAADGPVPFAIEDAPVAGVAAAEVAEGIAEGGGDCGEKMDLLGWREKVSRARGAGLVFAQSYNEPKLLLMTLVLEPLQALRNRQFKLSGKSWDRQQELRAAKSLKVGTDTIASRQYRVVVSATCAHEFKFLDEVRALLSPSESWSVLPIASRTVSLRSLAFRLLSRAAALVHELLVVPQQGCPWQLFTLLEKPELIAQVASTPICRRDRFTHDFLGRFPDLTSPHVRPTLHSLALEFTSDTGQIETLHATIRRRLLAASHNTHTELFAVLGSEWIALQSKHTMPQGRSSQTSKGGKISKKHAGPRRGGGGGYRAYVSAQVKSCGRDFGDQAAFAQEWGRLDDEEKESYIVQGTTATRRHREGNSAFGCTRKKEIDRLNLANQVADALGHRLAAVLDAPVQEQSSLAITPIRFEPPSYTLATSEQDLR